MACALGKLSSRTDPALAEMAGSAVDTVREDFDAICRRLNMDQGTMDVAWKSFSDLKEFYTLEGDQNHWLACALFVACRTVVIPTVDGGNSTAGNRVTLYNIIRETKISLLEFFERMKRWVEMALKHGLAKEVPTLVDNLEHRFRVITLIYRKYEDLFQAVFTSPSEEHRRKSSRSKCSSSDLHKFVWTLFVHARACLNGVQDNLVNSFHLLICVVETMYLSAVQAKRTDLINSEFTKTIDTITSEDPTKEKEVVDYLCQRYEADLMEVKVIREHWWERHLDEIKEKEILIDLLHEIVEGNVFHRNRQKLNKAYELYVMSVGDLDERIFLGEFAQAEVGTPIKVAAGSSVLHDRSRPAPRNLDKLFASASAGMVPNTPLTGADAAKARRDFRSPCPSVTATPVSSALYNMSRIKNIINNPQMGSAHLPKLCLKVDADLYNFVKQRVERIKSLFVEQYCASGSDATRQDEGNTIAALASALYFKILEAVAVDEYQRRGTTRLENVLQAEEMHLAMIGCCLQIVLTTKNTSDKHFPWVMEALDIPAYSFARVIESIIHFEPKLSASMVKSLKAIEEQLLECLVWRTGSPVFEQVRDIGRVYRFQEVALPDSTGANPVQQARQQMQHPAPPLQSLTGSPLLLSQRRPSARKLSFDESPEPPRMTASNHASSGASSNAFSLRTLSVAASLVDDGTDGGASGRSSGVSSPATGVQSTGAPSSAPSTTGDTPRRGDQAASAEPQPVRNAVSLFLRKVYHLASLRLNFLCQRLRMNDEEQQLCWTCFEECLVRHMDELQDRHIDQFIMCSIYAIGKVLKKDVEFADIVKFYKLQPNYQSATYRQVLISRKADLPASSSDTANDGAEAAAMPAKEQKETPSPKGSPATRASCRRQEQLRQEQSRLEQLKQEDVKSAPGTPSSPRRSPRKRVHETGDAVPASIHPARRSLFTSGSPPSKRKDFGNTSDSSSPAHSTPPMAMDDGVSTDTPMDTAEPVAKRTPRGAPPGLLSPAVPLPNGHCIGDIIAFYNKVYLCLMKDFLLRFTPEKMKQGVNPCLSPMPKNKSKPHSPRKQVSAHHNIFVSPRKKDYSPTPEKEKQEQGWFLYCHQRSSLSDLHMLNDRIRRGAPSPLKKPTHPALANQSPLLAGAAAAPTAAMTASSSKPTEPSGIMLESVSLSNRPAPSQAAVERRESVQEVLRKRAEEKWIESKGLSADTPM